MPGSHSPRGANAVVAHVFSLVCVVAFRSQLVSMIDVLTIRAPIDPFYFLFFKEIRFSRQAPIYLGSVPTSHRLAVGSPQLSLYLCFLGRFQEKGNLEVLLFTIQSRMRANNQKVYTPHDGKLVSDINRVQ